jgi:hypothetical protein
LNPDTRPESKSARGTLPVGGADDDVRSAPGGCRGWGKCPPTFISIPSNGDQRGLNTVLRSPSRSLLPSLSRLTSFVGTASRAPTVTLARFCGHHGAWPSEGEHAVRPYMLVSPFGACRGAQPLCVLLSPKSGGPKGVDQSPRHDGAAECCRGLGCPQIRIMRDEV